MRLTVEQIHSMETKEGVSRCSNCKEVEPDLKKPCPKDPRSDPAKKVS